MENQYTSTKTNKADYKKLWDSIQETMAQKRHFVRTPKSRETESEQKRSSK